MNLLHKPINHPLLPINQSSSKKSIHHRHPDITSNNKTQHRLGDDAFTTTHDHVEMHKQHSSMTISHGVN
jgi:hypothetical protein